MTTRTRTAAVAALLLALTTLPTTALAATDEPAHVEGRLPSGATYLMDVPADWMRTVLLFSHGYAAGPANPARDAPDDATKALLLQQGYALIGSSYATTGWAVTDAVPDQLATLTAFTERFGSASRTIAWGRSYGGLVTTAIATLEDRLTSGHWSGTDAGSLNSRAGAADSSTPARYVTYRPTPCLRPYDLAHPADGR